MPLAPGPAPESAAEDKAIKQHTCHICNPIPNLFSPMRFNRFLNMKHTPMIEICSQIGWMYRGQARTSLMKLGKIRIFLY